MEPLVLKALTAGARPSAPVHVCACVCVYAHVRACVYVRTHVHRAVGCAVSPGRHLLACLPPAKRPADSAQGGGPAVGQRCSLGGPTGAAPVSTVPPAEEGREQPPEGCRPDLQGGHGPTGHGSWPHCSWWQRPMGWSLRDPGEPGLGGEGEAWEAGMLAVGCAVAPRDESQHSLGARCPR